MTPRTALEPHAAQLRPNPFHSRPHRGDALPSAAAHRPPPAPGAPARQPGSGRPPPAPRASSRVLWVQPASESPPAPLSPLPARPQALRPHATAALENGGKRRPPGECRPHSPRRGAQLLAEGERTFVFTVGNVSPLGLLPPPLSVALLHGSSRHLPALATERTPGVTTHRRTAVRHRAWAAGSVRINCACA